MNIVTILVDRVQRSIPSATAGTLANEAAKVGTICQTRSTSERHYAYKLLAQTASEIEDAHQLALLKKVMSGIKEHDNLFPSYIACFSEEGDDLYQWRSYCQTTSGYSLGFDFRTSSFLKDNSLLARKVTYDVEKQKAEILAFISFVDLALEKICGTENTITEDELARFILVMSFHFQVFS